ncbi:MAG: DUF6792 domain-containing protein [Massilia sp.]
MLKFMRSAVLVALVGALSGGVLFGCGVYQVHSEAKISHRELADQAVAAYSDCRNGAATSMSQNRPGLAPDCFDLVVKQSPTRVGNQRGNDHPRDGDDAPPPLSGDAYAYIDQFAMMALFSKMVYHRYQDLGERNSPATCLTPTIKHPLTSLYDKASTNGRWQVWAGGAKGCYAKDGLYFETYVYYPAGTPPGGEQFTKAVIVFRGTENYQAERTADWGSNLGGAFGFRPKQYVAAAERLDGVIAELRRDRPANIEIYAAGHSLGGGLAQLAAYWSKGITAAFAFNATPVTGWTWVHEQRATLMNPDPLIYRVSQRTEALGVLRSVSTAVNSERFGRSDYDFDFRIREAAANPGQRQSVSAAVSEHDIGLLACHMAARVVLAHGADDGRARFDFTPGMAMRALRQMDKLAGTGAKNEKLCTDNNRQEVRNAVCGSANADSLLCKALQVQAE